MDRTAFNTIFRSLALGLILSQTPRLAAIENIDQTIDGLQKKYQRVRDLQMDFVQNYESPRRRPRSEAGVLYLRRPGMMRWEYRSPSAKLFVSSGKVLYSYFPDERQVQKVPVKESIDQRIPFLFLLGKGNLKRDFSKIESAGDKPFFPGNRVLYAFPKRSIDEFAKILMEFDPQVYQLQRVTIFEVDGSKSEFIFTNIKENQGVDAKLFEFQPPPGVEILTDEERPGR